MKILIIDDEIELLKMYTEIFRAAQIETLTALDGISGMKIAKEQKPSAILLDIIMPKINGLDVLKNLKGDPETKEIPVILLTNLPEECSGEKAKELGAVGYLVKAQNEPQQIVDFVKQNIQQ